MNWHPFTKYPGALGITLWRWGRKKVELWIAGGNCEPPEHSHDNVNSEFTILWARNRRIYRKTKWESKSWKTIDGRYGITHELVIGPKDEYVASVPSVWGKWLSVRAGTPHKFCKSKHPMVWIVVENWIGIGPMSLVEDFRITQ